MCEGIFKGTVFSGLGEGGFYVGIYTKGFREALGIAPYPGTLNLRMEPEEYEALSKCLSQLQPVIVRPPAIPGYRLGAAKVFPIELIDAPDLPAYIVRPDITVYKKDIVEIISTAFLRERLSLADGDVVAFRLMRR